MLLLAIVRYQHRSIWKTVLRNRPGGIGPLNVQQWLRSTVIGLNNFIAYSHCQAKQLFQLTPLLIKVFTTIIPKLIVCPCVRFSEQGSCLKFIKMRATPFVSLLKWLFYDCKCYVYRWRKETSTKPTLPIGWLWFTLLAVQTYNLNYKLPM